MYSTTKQIGLLILTACFIAGCSHTKQPIPTVKSGQETFTAEEVQVIIDEDRKGLVRELTEENRQYRRSMWRQQQTLDRLDEIRMECKLTLTSCLEAAGECVVELQECKGK